MYLLTSIHVKNEDRIEATLTPGVTTGVVRIGDVFEGVPIHVQSIEVARAMEAAFADLATQMEARALGGERAPMGVA